MKTVNTVAGGVSSDQLGVTLMHDHVVFGQIGWESDVAVAPLDLPRIEDHVVKKLTELKECGMTTLFNPTPADCTRMPELVKAASIRSGVNVICTTGLYDHLGGGGNYWRFRMSSGYDVVEEMTELFVKELTEGMEGTDIKAGAIKCATSANQITPYERNVLLAAARASNITGAPITTHTALGTMGHEQADLFLAEGVDPARVVIGHMCDCQDVDYLARLIDKGFSIGFDRMGLEGSMYGCPTDEERYPVLVELIQRGYADRINLSSDSAMVQPGRPTGKFWRQAASCRPIHIFHDVIPALKERGVSDAQIHSMLVENPKHVFES